MTARARATLGERTLLERLFLRAASLAEFPEAPDSGYRHLLVDGYRLLCKRIGIREGGTVQVAFARR